MVLSDVWRARRQENHQPGVCRSVGGAERFVLYVTFAPRRVPATWRKRSMDNAEAGGFGHNRESPSRTIAHSERLLLLQLAAAKLGVDEFVQLAAVQHA